MKRHRAMCAALWCSLLACASAQGGEVYKMVDKSGRVHYSDRPQAGWNKVNITPVPSTQALDPALADEQARREAECVRKKEDLQRYREASVIKEKDALGNVREYSPDEHQQLIAATQKATDEVCAPLPVAG